MKRITAILALFFLIQNLTAQFDTLAITKNIKSSADQMIVAFNNRDWAAFYGYTNENAIKAMGGKEAYIQLIDSTTKKWTELVTIDNYITGKVLQVVKTKAEYQCVLESFMQISASGTTVTASSYDVGTSPDGINWKFIRINDEAASGPRKYIPGLSPAIRMPKIQMLSGTNLEDFLKTYKVIYVQEKKPKARSVPAKTFQPAKPKTRS